MAQQTGLDAGRQCVIYIVGKGENRMYVDELKKIIDPDRVTINPTMLEQHSKDESYHPPCLPDAVVFPKTTEEVSQIAAWANEHCVPIIPFGVASGMEGQIIPQKGGISLDFQLMNRVLEVKPQDFLVRVQPGVTRMQLNKELKKYGLFFGGPRSRRDNRRNGSYECERYDISTLRNYAGSGSGYGSSARGWTDYPYGEYGGKVFIRLSSERTFRRF